MQRKYQLQEDIQQRQLLTAASGEASGWTRSETFRQLDFGDLRQAAYLPSFDDTAPPDYESVQSHGGYG